MLKKIGFATCLAGLAWLWGALVFFITEILSNFSWTHTDAFVKFPFGAFALLVLLNVVFIEICKLRRETLYQLLVACFLTLFLSLLGEVVFGIDLTENKSILIAKIVIPLSLLGFSWLIVLGFCKLWKMIRDKTEKTAFWGY